MQPVYIYSFSSTEASFNLADYKEDQHTICPFTPSHPKSLTEQVCQHLTFNETAPPTPEVDSEDEEYLPTADWMTQCGLRSLWQIARSTCISTKYPGQKLHLHNPIKWRCQQPDSHNAIKWRCQHPHPKLNQVDMTATSLQQSDQVEIPTEHELMELDIWEDIPDLIHSRGSAIGL